MSNLNVKVRAIARGQFGGVIRNVGEEFQYTGGLNAAGGLPLWVVPVDKNFKLPSAKAPASAPAAKKVTSKKVVKKNPAKPAPSADELV